MKVQIISKLQFFIVGGMILAIVVGDIVNIIIIALIILSR